MFFKVSKLDIDGCILDVFEQKDISYALHKIESGSKFYNIDLLYRLVEDEYIVTITGRNNLGSNSTRREIKM